MQRARKLLATGLASAALIAGVSIAATGSTSSGPTTPPWVGANGVVDVSKMPSRMPLYGPDGKVRGYVKTADISPDPKGRGNDATSIPFYKTPTSTTPLGQLPIGAQANGPSIVESAP